jgi:hypothetical protein
MSLNFLKAAYEKLTVNIVLNVKIETISSKISNKLRLSTLFSLIQYSAGISIQSNNERERNKTDTHTEERKKSNYLILQMI